MKLTNLHCSPSVVSWFRLYLLNRQQYELYNSISLDKVSVIHGTPVASTIRPVLFLIYINDFLTSLPEPYTLAYANDLTLIASDGNADMATLKFKSLLDVAHAWSLKNRLCLNATKCMFIILSASKRKNSTQPSISLRIGMLQMHEVSL